MTLREQARGYVSDNVAEAAANQHRRNYHRLHVYRTGKLDWSEHINPSDTFIDRGARHFAAIPSVIRAGTGGYICNCDYCGDAGYESIEDAIFDAVHDNDQDDIEAQMLAEFDKIPAGYFADEEEPEAELTEDQYD